MGLSRSIACHLPNTRIHQYSFPKKQTWRHSPIKGVGYWFVLAYFNICKPMQKVIYVQYVCPPKIPTVWAFVRGTSNDCLKTWPIGKEFVIQGCMKEDDKRVWSSQSDENKNNFCQPKLLKEKSFCIPQISMQVKEEQIYFPLWLFHFLESEVCDQAATYAEKTVHWPETVQDHVPWLIFFDIVGNYSNRISHWFGG